MEHFNVVFLLIQKESKELDVAIADFLHSHCLPFSLADDKKLMRVVEVARILGPNYKAPSHQDIGGKYLDALYQNLGCQLLSNSNLMLEVQNTGTFPCYCVICVYCYFFQ